MAQDPRSIDDAAGRKPGLGADAEGEIRAAVHGRLTEELKARLVSDLIAAREETARARYDLAAASADCEVLKGEIGRLRAELEALAQERESLRHARAELAARLERIGAHRVFRVWSRLRRWQGREPL